MPGPSLSPPFDEFAPASREDWQAAAAALLPKATSLDSLSTRTIDGFLLEPIHDAENCRDLNHRDRLTALCPASAGSAEPWLVVQSSLQPDPKDVNRELREGIGGGANAVQLFPHSGETGLAAPDPDSPPDSQTGTHFQTASDFSMALEGIAPDRVPLLVQFGARSLPTAALMVTGLRQLDVDLPRLSGSAGADPLAWLATQGCLPAAPDALHDEQAEWLGWCMDNAPGMDTIFLDGCAWHEAGANAVQELACSLANGTATLRAMLARGFPIDEVARRMALSMALDSDFLTGLAKLRAMRLLWARMIEAFGGTPASRRLTLHARTGRRNKSALDPWCNMLRTSLEALVAAIGGCDSLLVEPLDALTGAPGRQSRRYARNQQLILQQEVGLAGMLDPAGGSWTLEVLTDWLAREAWSLFQRIERRGGLLTSLQEGWIQEAVAAVAQQRSLRNARRQDVMVGSNQYVDTQVLEVDRKGRQETLARSAQSDGAGSGPGQLLQGRHARGEVAETLLHAAEQGATLKQLVDMLDSGPANTVSVTALGSRRLSAPWERLRANAAEFRKRRGYPLRVFLALCGDAAALHARASFVSDFFHAGGCECLDHGADSDPGEIARETLAADPALIVLCARDSDYPKVVAPFCDAIRSERPDALIYLAGRPPEDLKADWRVAGIDDFVHTGSDCLTMNQALQRQAGLAP